MVEQATRPVPLWRSPAFLIVVIAGCFHVGRGAAVDGVVFLGVAAALVVAELADRARPPLDIRVSNGWLAVVIGAAVVLGWAIGQWRAGTVPVAVAVALPGPPMLLLALRVGGHGPRQPVRSGWWRWAVVGVLICLWELASFLQQPDATTDSYDHPTLSVILGPAFATNPVRTVLLAGWLVAGVLLCRLLLTNGDRRVEQ